MFDLKQTAKSLIFRRKTSIETNKQINIDLLTIKKRSLKHFEYFFTKMLRTVIVHAVIVLFDFLNVCFTSDHQTFTVSFKVRHAMGAYIMT